MKKIILPFLLLLFIQLQVLSQTVTIYDAYSPKQTVDKKNVESGINNYVQWNFSLLTRGAFVLTYERKISNYLGLEIGFGPTMFLPISSLTDEDLDFGGDNPFSSNIGHFISASAKIYPKQMMDFDGFYIAPTIRNTQYNYDRSVIYDYDYDLEKNFSLSRKETDVALIFGYQYEGWSEIFGGCYAGFGYSYKSYQEITENGDNEEFELIEKKKANPRLYLGMTVGFSF